MNKKLDFILLVDDNEDFNFLHQRLLNKMLCTKKIKIARDGVEALEILKSVSNGALPVPSIIFLDVNMPRMNGWEFLAEFEKLGENVRAKTALFILTTSLNPDDREIASTYKSVTGFQSKYLTEEAINQILAEHFPEYR